MEIVLGCVMLITLIPIATYRFAARRAGREWTVLDKVASPVGGAYRGGWVWFPRDPGAPCLVKVASAWSLALVVPAILSLPVVLLGLMQEADHGVGPAVVFGPAGLLLAAMIFSAGVSLQRRRDESRRLARTVAIWSMVHNALVIVAVVLVAATEPGRPNGAWNAFGLHEMGGFALGYAAFSLAHAFTLLSAARVHARAARDASRSAGARDAAEVEHLGGTLASSSAE